MARLILAAFVLLVTAAAAWAQYFVPGQPAAEEPRKFASKQQMVEYIKANSLLAQVGFGRRAMDMRAAAEGSVTTTVRKEAAGVQPAAPGAAPPAGTADGYSTTNIQVGGVDEADIVKSDGRYLYTVSGRKVHIIEAYPPEKAGIKSSISCRGYPSGLYLNGQSLVVISRSSPGPGTQVSVYDVSDPANPVEVRSQTWEGYCASSRMIGKYAYLVLSLPVGFEGDDVRLPKFTENGLERLIPPEEIFYFDYPDHSYNYTIIAAINVEDHNRQSFYRTFLTGHSQNVYASTENLYLTGAKSPDMGSLTARYVEGLATLVGGDVAEKIRNISSSDLNPYEKITRAEQVLEEFLAGMDYAGAAALEDKISQMRIKFNRDVARERDKTVVHKFFLKENSVQYSCRGEVNGTLLNQFSMDESGGYFRVATTSQGYLLTDTPVTRNNIYVMDQNLAVIGKLEGLAPNERIFSARFMGNRAYMVTFRRVDPLFVIELKDPANPRVLGELKIPGFSDYLHPYDENHLIGVGKEVAVLPEPVPMPAAPAVDMRLPEIIPPLPPRQQGVKIALFDVTDPAKPVEKARYVVDRADSDSEVSRDHKAFLFSRSRNLMALPVSYTESRPVDNGKVPGVYPVYTRRQGMYVFSISPEDGIKLKGEISHPSPAGSEYEAYDAIRRAAYINDVLYTVSQRSVKMSKLDNLREIKIIPLPWEKDQYYPVKPMFR